MLFHVSHELSSENREAAQNRFKETGGLPPEGVEMIGRWHCAEGLRGFVLAETSDAVAIATWLQDWTDLLTFEVTPVVDDEQMMGVIS
jgi:hypothetical protein